ncbi:Hypothetical protein D9617_32g091720 [Elsinoe fawcettii]|nr:Hypothetical protein D9617_32g091720 [Elsinoe fawcettii]
MPQLVYDDCEESAGNQDEKEELVYDKEDKVYDIDDNDDVELQESLVQIQNLKRTRPASISSDATADSPYWIILDEWSEVNVRQGTVLKLRKCDDWLQVQQLFKDANDNDKLVIRGRRFRELSKLKMDFEKEKDEVMMIQDIYTDSIKDEKGFVLDTFSEEDVMPIEKSRIRLTNFLRPTKVPQGRMVDYFPEMDSAAHVRSGNIKICRSKYVAIYNGPRTRKCRKIEEAWMNLTGAEADTGHKFDDLRIRAKLKDIHQTAHVLEHDQRIVQLYADARNRGRYTACDAFCGAGFATAGCRLAGLQVVWSFDNNPDARKTYIRNHPDPRCLLKDFHDVVAQYGDRVIVDLLTLSFPRSFFSPAKTLPQGNDNVSEIVMLGFPNVLEKLKPRVVFKQYLGAVVAWFRNKDYSVRKGVFSSAGFGLAITRRRLMFVAAAPGEALPPFPKYTHNLTPDNPDPKLLPAVTISDILSRVRVHHPEHKFDRAAMHGTQPASDPARSQAGTFTCNRSKDKKLYVHWSGTRYWTLHEMLLLQGAPPEFRLTGTTTTKLRQIGSASPSLAAEHFYRECEKSLRATDEADTQRRHREYLSSVNTKTQEQPQEGSSAEHPIALD